MSAKYALMDEEKANYPVVLMADWLKLSRQGYYQWVKANQARSAARRHDVTQTILRLWEASDKRHGARRIQVELGGEGVVISVWLVRKLMRRLRIAGVQPRTSKKTTIPDPNAQTRPDLVRRQFCPPVATTVLVGDITYLKTGEGWLYLATVIDLTTRMVVGWAMADHMRASLAIDALKMAYKAGYVAGNAIFHSDRGAQYTSKEMMLAAKAMNIRLSCGRTGVCWDNSVAESFFASLKNEMYYRQTFATRAKARLAVATYIEVYYNRARPHSTIGYRTPAQSMAEHTFHLPVEPQTDDENLPLAA